jgi:hypothetical protein
VGLYVTRTVPTVLSVAAWRALARTEVEEDTLRRWLAGVSAEERRAFWIGVLVVDGKTTMLDVLNGVARHGVPPAPPPPPPEPDPPKVRPVSVDCEWCGGPIEVQPTGPLPRYHGNCRRRASESRTLEPELRSLEADADGRTGSGAFN